MQSTTTPCRHCGTPITYSPNQRVPVYCGVECREIDRVKAKAAAASVEPPKVHPTAERQAEAIEKQAEAITCHARALYKLALVLERYLDQKGTPS